MAGPGRAEAVVDFAQFPDAARESGLTDAGRVGSALQVGEFFLLEQLSNRVLVGVKGVHVGPRIECCVRK